jgi:hypothetical protein
MFFGLAADANAVEPLGPVKGVVMEAYGKVTADGIRLLKSELAAGEPLTWLVFAEDPHRMGDLIKLRVQREPGNGGWGVTTVGAGQLLQRVPPMRLDFAKVKVGPVEARRIASQGAALARTTFERVEFQLAMQPTTRSPEWAMVLADAAGKEVGFLVVSAESGAVIHQDFGRVQPLAVDSAGKGKVPDEPGEEAARAVKRGVRKAWDWTEHAGKETRGFFRELFR